MTKTSCLTAGLTLLGVLALAADSQASGSKACKTSSLKGPYGFSAHGTILGLPYAELGRLEADGKGRVRGKATRSFDGDIRSLSFSGTYEVSSDCTGTASLTGDPRSTTVLPDIASMTGTRGFVVMDGGKHIDYIYTVDGTVVAGSLRRVKATADDDDDDDDHHGRSTRRDR